MTIEMHPLGLDTATSTLMLRFMRLSQDYRRRGLEAACQYHDDIIARTGDELARVVQPPGSGAVTDFSAEILMRLSLASLSGMMAMAGPLFAAQVAFAHGLQQALQEAQAVPPGPAGEA